jgi:uncharacterized protein (DUF1697 family)
MATYVALLRGINVGGNKMVAMAELRAALTKAGFSNVRTLLQSGNVVLDAVASSPVKLESQLEAEVKKRFSLQVEVHVRSAAELAAVIEANPFAAEATRDPSHLLVTFFKTPLDVAKVKATQAAIAGPERLQADGRHLYMVFPEGIGHSKATVVVGRMLGPGGTARNWNTVQKLAALAPVRGAASL